MKKILINSMILSVLLTACASKTEIESLGADVYDTQQLNVLQSAELVEIISILPAKVAISNSGNQNKVATAGAVLGAVAGALIGSSNHAAGAITGGVAGAALGGVAGDSVVSDKTLVEGVSLAYQKNGKLYTSTQAGKKCQFKLGQAIMIKTQSNDTRIQPNATCPSN